MPDYAIARHNMVESQIRTNKVTDAAVIDAFAQLPRERFVPDRLRGIAYVDEDVQIAPGRYMSEPMVLARLVQEARPEASDVGLVIGAGNGYSTAVLARLCTTVMAVEEDRDLARRAAATLSDLSVDNAVVVDGPLSQGYPRQAPFDVILVDGGIEVLPDTILEQLAEGGRLVMVERSGPVGRAVIVTRRGGIVSRRVLFDAATPVLPGFGREPAFTF